MFLVSSTQCRICAARNVFPAAAAAAAQIKSGKG
jgi:hypothetical protein